MQGFRRRMFMIGQRKIKNLLRKVVLSFTKCTAKKKKKKQLGSHISVDIDIFRKR